MIRHEVQFKRMVTAQVVMGIVAFCMAENNPGLLLVMGALAVLSWFMTEGPDSRPLPRILVNLGALAAVGWLVVDIKVRGMAVINAMGHFTMAMQLIMLYGKKSNREYAQIMVLSLMQMIGASVLSVSVVYGAVLVAYCVLSLWTLLLFQFKAAGDLVHEANRAAAPFPDRVLRPPTVYGRGYRWHFRGLAGAIAGISACVAVGVFVITPRSEEPQFDAAIKGSTIGRESVGFSKTVSMTSSPNTTASQRPVMTVAIRLDGLSVGREGQDWLLRGTALDKYDAYQHVWRRSLDATHFDQVRELGDGLALLPGMGDSLQYEADITLRQSGHRTLFTLHPVTYAASRNFRQVRFSDIDQQLEAVDAAAGAVVYTLRWPATQAGVEYRSWPQEPRHMDILKQERKARRERGRDGEASDEATYSSYAASAEAYRVRRMQHYARYWKPGRKQVAGMARNILQESGYDITLEAKLPDTPRTPDAEIPERIAEYLRSRFSYTLDNPPVEEGKDPVLEFLLHRQQGHCELFAAGLAALVRSVGMQARVVTGYRTSEFNNMGGYFVVRQANAHAWTEVYCGPGKGWQAFDATPPDAVREEHEQKRAWWTSARDIYEYLEWHWVGSVVAYDQKTRDAVIEGMRDSVNTAASNRESRLGKLVQFFKDLPNVWRLDRVNYTIAGIIVVAILVALGSLLRTMVVRRQRLHTLQLAALPRARRRGLVRKLRFYLVMLDLLERYGYARPEWQSPQAFAQELIAQDTHKFTAVLGLTQVFYEVRFGHRNLSNDRRAQVRAMLSDLEDALAGRK